MTNDTQTLTLTEFVLQRIAEDEEAARDAALAAGAVGYGDERIASGRSWSTRYHEVVRPLVPDVSGRRTIADCGGFAGLSVAPHIARHDPARVLAECEANRRIVERAARASEAFEQSFNPTTSGVSMTMDLVLADLAAVYSDHPDYRDEWRP